MFSLPASQDRGHDTRTAASVHDRDNPQGLFLRSVGNQVFAHKSEPQRPRTEVGASVARPLCAARSVSFFSTSGVKCTSMGFNIEKNCAGGKLLEERSIFRRPP